MPQKLLILNNVKIIVKHVQFKIPFKTALLLKTDFILITRMLTILNGLLLHVMKVVQNVHLTKQLLRKLNALLSNPVIP